VCDTHPGESQDLNGWLATFTSAHRQWPAIDNARQWSGGSLMLTSTTVTAGSNVEIRLPFFPVNLGRGWRLATKVAKHAKRHGHEENECGVLRAVRGDDVSRKK
jgi:hypothetical protein